MHWDHKPKLETAHLYFTVFTWSSYCVETTHLSGTHCPFRTVSDLIIYLLHIGFHPQMTSFSFRLFSLIKNSTASSSTIVWINNLPVYNPNLHITNCLSFFVRKEAFRMLMKRVCWKASDLHFLSRTTITMCQRHKKLESFFAVHHDRGATSSALFQVVLSKLDIQHSQWSDENKAKKMSNFLW